MVSEGSVNGGLTLALKPLVKQNIKTEAHDEGNRKLLTSWRPGNRERG
jgi:hypothetical protein